MKKNFVYCTIIVLCTLISGIVSAKQIPASKAQSVAEQFLQSGMQTRSTTSLSLIETKTSKSLQRNASSSDVLYYVFSINGSGYIIVGGDDLSVPVIGYSYEATYEDHLRADNFRYWMESVEMGIQNAIERGGDASERVKTKWENIGKAKSERFSEVVEPLLTTQWGQEVPYFNLVPIEREHEFPFFRRPPTGCIATAMAQIMNYHKYPVRGFGTTPEYITDRLSIEMPSVNLTDYIYDWANMADTYYSDGNNEVQDLAVATLMYHAGLSVQMDYYWGESGSYSEKVMPALVTNFGYDNSADHLLRLWIDSDEEWIAILKDNLNKNQPVFYSGHNGSMGHAFVCDGYKENNQFHFNWGNGRSGGHYDLDAPGGYSNSHAIVYNIKPGNGVSTMKPNYNLLMFGLSSDATLVKRGDVLTCEYVAYNSIGPDPFEGSCGYALFGEDGELKYILGEERVTLTFRGFQTLQSTLTIPEEAEAGNYILRGISRLADLKPKIIRKSNYMVVDAIPVTIENRNTVGAEQVAEDVSGVDIYLEKESALLHVKALQNIQDIKVVNVAGQVVLNENGLNVTERQLSMQSLPKGVYIIQVNMGKEIYSHKVIRN